MSCRTLLLAFVSVVAALSAAAHAGTPSEAAPIDVRVHEGTSMAVAGFCRKCCSEGHTGAVAPVCAEITQRENRTVRPQ